MKKYLKTSFDREITYIMAGVMIIIAVSFGIQFYLQKRKEKKVRQSIVQGIILDKQDLNRGDFLLIIDNPKGKAEYVHRGYTLFFDKYSVGDSVVKNEGTDRFDIYRKKEGTFKYIYTVGL